MKKQAMRANIEESFRLRETTDNVLAATLVKKEAQINSNLFKKPGKKRPDVDLSNIIGKLDE